MPRFRSILLGVTVALATIACKRAEDLNERYSPAVLAADPPQELDGELFMRIEGSPDAPSLIVESVVADDDRLLFPVGDGRVAIYEPTQLRVIDPPTGMHLFAVHDHNMLFYRTDPGNRRRPDFGSRTIYALAQSRDEPRELARFETATTPLLVGDAIVAITEQNRMIHRAISGGETRVGPQAPGIKSVGTPDAWGDGLVWVGVDSEATYVVISRAPFDSLEVAVELPGYSGTVIDAAWAGDDSIIYLVVSVSAQLRLFRKTSDTTSLLLDGDGSTIVRNNAEAAFVRSVVSMAV